MDRRNATAAATAAPLVQTRPARILVADDQPDVLEALRLLLKARGSRTVAPPTRPPASLGALERSDFDAVLIDLNYARDTTSGRRAWICSRASQALDATLPVVVMTAWGSVDGAVEAMRRGARDYVEKPWDNARLVADAARPRSSSAARCASGRRLEDENQRLRGGSCRRR